MKETKEQVQKKSSWKGKDWYAILAPESFSGKQMGEVPSTDPALLMGRNIEVSMMELGGDPKMPVRLRFRVDSVENRKAHTTFNGYSLTREFLSRAVRKRSDKVDLFVNAETKDGHSIQLSILFVTNRNIYHHIRTNIAKLASAKLADMASKMTLDDFVIAILEKQIQREIRSAANKIYPIRFFDIAKIEMIKQAAKMKKAAIPV